MQRRFGRGRAVALGALKGSLAGPRGVRREQESHCKAIKGVTLLICFLFIKKKKLQIKQCHKILLVIEGPKLISYGECSAWLSLFSEEGPLCASRPKAARAGSAHEIPEGITGPFPPSFIFTLLVPFPCLSFQILWVGAFPNVSSQRRFLFGSLTCPLMSLKPTVLGALPPLFVEPMPWISRPPRAGRSSWCFPRVQHTSHLSVGLTAVSFCSSAVPLNLVPTCCSFDLLFVASSGLFLLCSMPVSLFG